MELSLFLFLPLLGGISLTLFPANKTVLFKSVTILIQILTLLIASYFLYQKGSLSLAVSYDWISYLGVTYSLRLEGVGFLLCMLTVFLFPLMSLGLQKSAPKSKWLWLNILVLQTGLLGVFLAADIFLFYVFWEVALIPMYFIILFWGGEKRVASAIKFFIYTMASSFIMLFAIFVLSIISYYQLGKISFSLADWQELQLGLLEPYFFWAFFIPFAVKIPLFPFHSWMPDTYKNAPWIGTIFLSALLSKMGIYGLIYIVIPLFPLAAQSFSHFILILAIISILYGAIIAITQKDLKLAITYSSFSHLGMIVFGIFSFHFLTWNGAILQIMNHAITVAGLFFLIWLLAEHFGSTKIGSFYGLAKVTPKFCVFFLLFSLSAIGFPSTGSFIGELLIFLGSFASVLWYALLAALGVILSAIYMLNINQKIFYGAKPKEVFFQKKDLSFKELVILLPMLAMIFWVGIYPQPFLARFEIYIQQTLEKILIHLL